MSTDGREATVRFRPGYMGLRTSVSGALHRHLPSASVGWLGEGAMDVHSTGNHSRISGCVCLSLLQCNQTSLTYVRIDVNNHSQGLSGPTAAEGTMDYSEAAYFPGAHVAHIAAWQDHQRVRRIAKAASAQTRDNRASRLTRL
jgi:hypothetical protein